MRSNSQTLGQSFDPRHNSLNAIRLILALVVVVSHSWPLGGYGDDPRWGDQNLGEWAVAGFFTISGYLILMSRLRSTSLWTYLWRRFLRIYPAFIVCLILVAFVVAPISGLLDGRNTYSVSSAVAFLLKNAALLINQFGINGTLTTVPFDGAWVGPMWTLFYEFACYLWIGLLVTLVPRKWLTYVLVVVLVLCALGCIYGLMSGWDLSSRPARMLRLSGYFAAGSLVYVFRHSINLAPVWAALASVAVGLSMFLGIFHIVAGLPLAYLMMYLGARLPLRRIGSRNDISYGLYIWAFPVQQLIAIVFQSQQLPLLLFVAFSIACTLPLAWASWLFVERPASKLKYVRPFNRLRASRGEDLPASSSM